MQEKKLTKEKVAEYLRRGHYVSFSYNERNQKIRKFDNKKFREHLRQIDFDLSGTNLRGVQFQDADLSNVNFCRCDLRNTVFRNNNLGDISMKNWKGVKVVGAKIEIESHVKYGEGFEIVSNPTKLIKGLQNAARDLETRRKFAKWERESRIKDFQRMQTQLEEQFPYYAASIAKTSKEKVDVHRKARSWLQNRRRIRTKPR